MNFPTNPQEAREGGDLRAIIEAHCIGLTEFADVLRAETVFKKGADALDEAAAKLRAALATQQAGAAVPSDVLVPLRRDDGTLSGVFLAKPATPAPTNTGAAGAGEVKTWQVRLLENGNMGNEHVHMEAEIAAPSLPAEAESAGKAAAVDWEGLALELEAQAKRVESQTVERAMLAAASGLRLMGPKYSLESVPVIKYKLMKTAYETELSILRERLAQFVGPVVKHPIDAAVDSFAEDMKLGMMAGSAEGKDGWDDPARCTVEKLAADLIRAVTGKGNPVTIANYCMMLHLRKGTGIDVSEALGVWLNQYRSTPLDPAIGEKSTLTTSQTESEAVPTGCQINDAAAAPTARKEAAGVAGFEATLQDWLTVIHDSDLEPRDRLQRLSSRISTLMRGNAALDRAPQAERLDEALATFLAEHTRLNQDGIDSHAMKMSISLNYAALNPVPESEFEEWREQGYLEDAAPQEQVERAAVPEGCVLVPKEPTQAMCDAARKEAADWQNSGDPWSAMTWFRIYRAMLAAAPAAQEERAYVPASEEVAADLRDMIDAQEGKAVRGDLAAVDCPTCNGVGLVGGHTGQTPESYEEVTLPCDECSGQGKIIVSRRDLAAINDPPAPTERTIKVNPEAFAKVLEEKGFGEKGEKGGKA